jgi:hypothetical protein
MWHGLAKILGHCRQYISYITTTYSKNKICLIFFVLSVNTRESVIFCNGQNDENLKEVHYSQEDLDLKTNQCLLECIHHHQYILE